MKYKITLFVSLLLVFFACKKRTTQGGVQDKKAQAKTSFKKEETTSLSLAKDIKICSKNYLNNPSKKNQAITKKANELNNLEVKKLEEMLAPEFLKAYSLSANKAFKNKQQKKNKSLNLAEEEESKVPLYILIAGLGGGAVIGAFASWAVWKNKDNKYIKNQYFIDQKNHTTLEKLKKMKRADFEKFFVEGKGFLMTEKPPMDHEIKEAIKEGLLTKDAYEEMHRTIPANSAEILKTYGLTIDDYKTFIASNYINKTKISDVNSQFESNKLKLEENKLKLTEFKKTKPSKAKYFIFGQAIGITLGLGVAALVTHFTTPIDEDMSLAEKEKNSEQKFFACLNKVAKVLEVKIEKTQ